MSTVYLNGNYLPMSEARISPMDRGFLFGDGIYEVVPSYDGKLVGFAPHMARMQHGLDWQFGAGLGATRNSSRDRNFPVV